VTKSAKRGWGDAIYGGEPQRHWREIIYLSCAHFIYCVVATTLYLTLPAFERFIVRLDWTAVALEDIIPVLWHYVVVLPRLGERDWVFLARHIALVSLAVNLAQLAFYVHHRRKFLDVVVGRVLAMPHSRWWNGSVSRYVVWVLASGVLPVVLICLIYVWRGPLEMTGSRGFYVQNGYVRSLFFMPLMTFLLAVLSFASLTLTRALFSDRLRAGLR
jgi:hypothetical protein